MTNRIDFDFNIPTALKGWVGHAPQGRGALHNYYISPKNRKSQFDFYFHLRTIYIYNFDIDLNYTYGQG